MKLCMILNSFISIANMVDTGHLYGVNSHLNEIHKPNLVTAVIGAQWGDEGKGKIVDLLAQDAHVVCRCQVCCMQY